MTTTPSDASASSATTEEFVPVPFYSGIGSDCNSILHKAHPKDTRIALGGNGFRAQLVMPPTFNDGKWVGNVNLGFAVSDEMKFRFHSMAGDDSTLPRPANGSAISHRPWARFGEFRIEDKSKNKNWLTQMRTGYLRTPVGDNAVAILGRLRTRWGPAVSTDARLVATRGSMLFKPKLTVGTNDGLSVGVYGECDLNQPHASAVDAGLAAQYRSTNGSALGLKVSDFGNTTTYFGSHTWQGDRKTNNYTQCSFEMVDTSKLTIGIAASTPFPNQKDPTTSLLGALKAGTDGAVSGTLQFKSPSFHGFTSLGAKPLACGGSVVGIRPSLSVGVGIGDY